MSKIYVSPTGKVMPETDNEGLIAFYERKGYQTAKTEKSAEKAAEEAAAAALALALAASAAATAGDTPLVTVDLDNPSVADGQEVLAAVAKAPEVPTPAPATAPDGRPAKKTAAKKTAAAK